MDATDELIWAPARPARAEAWLDAQGRSDVDGWKALQPERTLFEIFSDVVARQGDAIAVADGRTVLTYRELHARASAIGAQLAGLTTDRPVVSLIGPTVNYAAVLLGALAAGVPLAPIDPSHPLDRRTALMAETRPAAVLVDSDTPSDAALGGEGAARMVVGASVPPLLSPQGLASSLSGVAYTSGSTGLPKGLAYDQSATLAFVRESVRALRIDTDDHLISLASLAAGGNLDILAAVLTGARVRLLDLKAAGMGEALQVLADERITLVSMVPLVFRALLAAPESQAAFAQVRAITMGGDRVTGADLSLFRSRLPAGCAIRVTQGSTESAVVFHGVVDQGEAFDADETAPSGWIAHDRQFALIDEEGRSLQVEEGAQGEVVVASTEMARGYWRDGALTPGPFVRLEDGRQLFHTGDVVRIVQDGRATFVGRRDRMIKILGLRADLAEIEAVLASYPEIAEVAVTARRDAGQDPVLTAFFKPHALRAPPTARVLRAFARSTLPPHMVPAQIRLVAAVPRLANYKVDAVALEALESANATEAEPSTEAAHEPESVAPSLPPSPVVRAVDRAWALLLGAGAGLNDRSWRASGGDSLKQLQLLLMLERDLGRKLSFDLFAGDFTSASLAQRIAQSWLAQPVTAAGPRVFLAPGLGGDEPSLAELRRLLETELSFHVLHLPDLDEPERVGSRQAILADVLGQIAEVQPKGPLRLLGHSLGAAVAFEAARALRRRGRDVEFLGIIDAPSSFAHSDPSRLPSRRVERLNLHDPLAGLRHGLIRALLASLGVAPMQQFERWSAQRLGPQRGMFLRQALLERTRGAAFNGWSAKAYNGPLWLFRADEQPPNETRWDLGWSSVVKTLSVIPVPGTHHSLMREGVEATSARLLSQIWAARSEA